MKRALVLLAILIAGLTGLAVRTVLADTPMWPGCDVCGYLIRR